MSTTTLTALATAVLDNAIILVQHPAPVVFPGTTDVIVSDGMNVVYRIASSGSILWKVNTSYQAAGPSGCGSIGKPIILGNGQVVFAGCGGWSLQGADGSFLWKANLTHTFDETSYMTPDGEALLIQFATTTVAVDGFTGATLFAMPYSAEATWSIAIGNAGSTVTSTPSATLLSSYTNLFFVNKLWQSGVVIPTAPPTPASPVTPNPPGVTTTSSPGGTLAPGQTMGPGQTMVPGQTMGPGQTMSPGQTLAPGQTGAPGVTAGPVSTQSPFTAAPVVDVFIITLAAGIANAATEAALQTVVAAFVGLPTANVVVTPTTTSATVRLTFTGPQASQASAMMNNLTPAQKASLGIAGMSAAAAPAAPESGSSTGVIVGVVVAVVVVVGAVIGVVIFMSSSKGSSAAATDARNLAMFQEELAPMSDQNLNADNSANTGVV